MQTEMHLLDESSLFHDQAPITLGMIKFSKQALGKGRELKGGAFAKLSCTVKQDANKGSMGTK